jgi:AcrR family transcriptional regulator
MKRQTKISPHRDELTARCLAAFIQAGTFDLSLDRLAKSVKISKRMLVHYFGDREAIEENAMTLLEEKLRAQFAPKLFPTSSSIEDVLALLWKQTTDPKSRGALLLVMDVSRRAWNGSKRAQAFYAEQQRLWVQLLMTFLPNRAAVEEVLQRFQGSVLAYLVTGDPEPGRRSLSRPIHTG